MHGTTVKKKRDNGSCATHYLNTTSYSQGKKSVS